MIKLFHCAFIIVQSLQCIRDFRVYAYTLNVSGVVVHTNISNTLQHNILNVRM